MSPGFTAILNDGLDHMIMAWCQVAARVVLRKRLDMAVHLLSTHSTAFTVILQNNSLTTTACHTAARVLVNRYRALHCAAVARLHSYGWETTDFPEVVEGWLITRHSVSWNNTRERLWDDEWKEKHEITLIILKKVIKTKRIWLNTYMFSVPFQSWFKRVLMEAARSFDTF